MESTPNSELRELINKLESKKKVPPTCGEDIGRNRMINELVNEIKDVIENNE